MAADFRIQCITAEGNYAVGDEIGLGSLLDHTARGPALSAGRLQASFTLLSGGVWQGINKTTGALFNLTPANWRYRVIAERGW
jgi:hypothetical protein